MSAVKEVKPRLNIMGYSLFYADKKSGSGENGVIHSRLLRSERHGLTGKPDYIFKRGRRMIPVELKSGALNGAGVPYEGDVMQLAAYFIIIKDEFGRKPRQGRLIYSDTMFIIKNRWRLRRRLLKTLRGMREMLAGGVAARDPEPGFAKCRYCVCRETVCEFHE
ncbi:MAG: CRISPR-associated protein Cas4 [Clostridiales bacterium]|jgi:CRISPR-associated exonuclease Cas4|nr:CRISPR-associated protein Cas4 [Clostridiales bacterium]